MKKDHIKDFYFHKAKREKYSARSVYKLKNIQDKYHILAPGNRVLDLGASPGSWSQYVAELIGPKGGLWAIDQKPLAPSSIDQISKIGLRFEFFEGSVFDSLPESLPEMDVVLSDMAPWTGGNKLIDSARSLELVEKAFEIACKRLKLGGHFVVKLFQSEDSIEKTKAWRAYFKLSKLYKPPSTHKESKEIYFVGRHRLPLD